jgi:hypothetical protein
MDELESGLMMDKSGAYGSGVEAGRYTEYP